jgi:hypothetical protein
MRIDPTQAELKQLLHYDPATGVWTWLKRTPDMFSPTARSGRGTITAEMNCDIWNRKFAGKTAGSADANGYWVIRIGKYQFKAHLLASIYMTGSRPAMMDHENLERSDNAWVNIRPANRSQNNANVGARKNNRLGIKGVRRRGSRFEARLSFEGKCHQLGTFDSVEEAESAVSAAAHRLHGEFARTTEKATA